MASDVTARIRKNYRPTEVLIINNASTDKSIKRAG